MRKVFNILLLLICTVSIFLLSSEDKVTSTNTSIETTKRVVDVVNEEISDEIAINYFGEIRKSAHFIEYLCLGILVINVVKDYKKLNFKWIIICILFCLLYSVSDEFHQYFVPGRSCELRDIIIDTCGSFIGIMFYYMIRKKSISN